MNCIQGNCDRTIIENGICLDRFHLHRSCCQTFASLYVCYISRLLFCFIKKNINLFQIMWTKCILITFGWLQGIPLGPVHDSLKPHWAYSRYVVEFSKFPAVEPNKHKLGYGQPWKYLHNGCSTLQIFATLHSCSYSG